MITICGDLHIKYTDKYSDFIIDRYLKLFDLLTKNDTLILAGDIFDKQPNFFEVGLFINLINKAKENNIQIFIVEGNHDYTRKTKYLELLCKFVKFPNLYFPVNNETIKINNFDFTFVHNSYIRYGGDIKLNNGILISHIACELPQYNKAQEYALDTLNSYDYVILGDIHFLHHYKDNIYYTSSPYRTNVKTIQSIDEIDNSFYGFINFNSKINYVEPKLPNIYKTSNDLKYSGEDILEIEKPDEIEEIVKKVYNITDSIEIKQDNFIETIINSIVEILKESPDRLLNELKRIGVIHDY